MTYLGTLQPDKSCGTKYVMRKVIILGDLMKQLFFFLLAQIFIFISLANAEVRYYQGENCEYTKNKRIRVLPKTLISISEDSVSTEINFFNVIDESGALLVGLSKHEYSSKYELEFPIVGKVSRFDTFSLNNYEDGIKYYGHSGNYAKRAMAIVFDKEEIKKIEYVLWDNSHQTDEYGGVTLDGAYRYKCESISKASPEFIQSIASSSFQASFNAGFISIALPFSYTDNVKGLDFEDSFSIIYKVNGLWKYKKITKSYVFSGLTSYSSPEPSFQIESRKNRGNINFDKLLTFIDRTPKYASKDFIEAQLIFQRRYKSSSIPALKIETKLFPLIDTKKFHMTCLVAMSPD